MQNIITVGERHGLLIVFLNVLLSQGGLPLPVVPTLMTVAALARQNPYQITQIILAGVSGALIADAALYWCGLIYSRPFAHCGGDGWRYQLSRRDAGIFRRA